MSHAKIGFLIVGSILLTISSGIVYLTYQAMPASHKQNDQETSEAGENNQKNSSEHPKPEPVRAINHLIDTLAGNIDDRPNPKGDLSDEDRRNEQDLIAQRIMARWTFGIFVATALSVILMGIGTYLVYFTLRETRKATLAAADAAESAQAAVTVTRELGMVQTRAYVSVVAVGVENIELGKQPFFKIVIKNSGQSPALDVRTQTQIKACHPNGDHKIYFGSRNKAVESSKSRI